MAPPRLRGPGGRFSKVVAVKSGVFQLTLPASPLFIPDAALPIVNAIARDYLELALQYVAGAIAERAPRNMGHLAQSFLANPAGTTGGIELLGADVRSHLSGRVFSSLPYAIVMDQGRAPNKPISRAGVAAIGLWVRRKLQLSGREAQSAMYAIAWSIRVHGLAGTQYAQKGFVAAAPEVEEIFRRMNAGIAEGLAGAGQSGVGGAA